MADDSLLIPSRADHRFIQKILSIVLPGKVEQTPSTANMISKVFLKAGGSWERVFKGSAKDIHLMKKICKIAYKKGFLKKKEVWP